MSNLEELDSMLNSPEYNAMLSCVEEANPPAKIKRIVSDIRKTRSKISAMPTPSSIKSIIQTMEVLVKLIKLVSDTEYLRFMIMRCPEEYVRHMDAYSKKALSKITQMISKLKKHIATKPNTR
jgi:hypothetical protein